MERISTRCSQGFNSATKVIFSFAVVIRVTTTVAAAVIAAIMIAIPSSIVMVAVVISYFLEN